MLLNEWEKLILGDKTTTIEPKVKKPKYQPHNKWCMPLEKFKEIRVLIGKYSGKGMTPKDIRPLLLMNGFNVSQRYVNDRAREYKQKIGLIASTDERREYRQKISEIIMRHVKAGHKNRLIHRELKEMELDKIYSKEKIQYRASEARLICKSGHSYVKHSKWFLG